MLRARLGQPPARPIDRPTYSDVDAIDNLPGVYNLPKCLANMIQFQLLYQCRSHWLHLYFLFTRIFYFMFQGIADTMAYLQGEGRLLRGEHNLLGEAFLVMASAAG